MLDYQQESWTQWRVSEDCQPYTLSSGCGSVKYISTHLYRLEGVRVVAYKHNSAGTFRFKVVGGDLKEVAETLFMCKPITVNLTGGVSVEFEFAEGLKARVFLDWVQC